MDYSKLQKITSGLIIFSLLFSITFRVPFFSVFNNVKASDKDFYNLVSIIVNEDVYAKLQGKLTRYGQDIQGVLGNTRAVILPVPNDVSAFELSSLNESLYFEGYKSLKNVDFESRLIGTVLVGDLPVPTIEDNAKLTKSVLPYTDFEDKVYIYDHDSKTYKKNIDISDDLRAEIWHGIISPNTGNENQDIADLKSYFDKNHDFYNGTGEFEVGKNILNGKDSDGLESNYEPFVFYFDQFREEKSIYYPAYKGYLSYLENKEDLSYHRFNKDLAEEIKDQVLGAENDEVGSLIESIDSEELKKAFENSSGPDTTSGTDITSRLVINNTIKNFIEIFNEGQLDEFKTNVHNAGRYNGTGSEVNVDLIPYFISVLDVFSDEVIKNVNTDLENKIDDLVENNLSRDIALATEITKYGSTIYTNILHGNQGKDIEDTSACTIYRGSTYNSGTLVESNRGLNINNLQSDLDILSTSCKAKIQNPYSSSSLKGYWGGNTPLNIYTGSLLNGGEMELKEHYLNKSIVPLYDILGSKEVDDETKNPSPLNCLDNNFMLIKEVGHISNETRYKVPINGQSSKNWSCTKDNIILDQPLNFESLYFNSLYLNSCADEESKKLILNGETVAKSKTTIVNSRLGNVLTIDCSSFIYNYYYKTIASYMTHKSPTSYELIEEIKNPITPNLPIDKDRYIDFIGANGLYKKINYPYLFRIDDIGSSDNNFEQIKTSLKDYLDKYSLEVNNIIDSVNPDYDNKNLAQMRSFMKELFGEEVYQSLGVQDKSLEELKTFNEEISSLLYDKDFDDSRIDLNKYLQDKPLKTVTIDGDEKEVSYYDLLSFAIYWKNLNNISGKYKFVIENYLSDQFGGNLFNFLLAKNKKEYEISYLGAVGDTQNMYIKMDPDSKGENPYADILSKNSLLNSNLLSLKVINSDKTNDAVFKCAPPDGVPIWEWIPAIVCRINNMLPVSIGISDGGCGESLLNQGELEELENFEEENDCKGDLNKNGVNDCVELKLEGANLDLVSDNSKYYYGTTGQFKVTLKDSQDKKVFIDSSSLVNFSLSKIIDRETGETVFDSNQDDFEDSLRLINKYLLFNEYKVRLTQGEANYSFGVKNIDSDIYFNASIQKLDNKGNQIAAISSQDLKVEVRGDKLFLDSSSVLDSEIDLGANEVKASDSTNIYLYDTKNTILDNAKSLGGDKLFFGLLNISKFGEKLDLSYPLNLNIYDSFGQSVFQTNISNISGFQAIYSLKEAGTYSLQVVDSDGFTIKKDFDIIAGNPEKIDISLGTSILEKDGALTTNIVTIYDKYNNPVVGEFLDIDLKILGDSIVFSDEGGDQVSYTTVEGFRAFRLLSTDESGVSKLQAKLSIDGEEILSSSTNIRVVDQINIDISSPDIIKVGKNNYNFQVTLKDKNNSVLDDLNSRIYLSISGQYGKVSNPYVDVKNGKANIDFQTSTLAGKNINVEYQVEGLKNIYRNQITILPEKAIKLDLKTTKSSLEASSDAYSFVNAELKDIYGNVVFNDNETNINLEILDKYKSIVKSDELSKKVSEGKASFKVYATNNPGTSYLKLFTNPSLENNSFDLVGQSPFAKSELDGIAFVLLDGKLSNIGEELFYEVDQDNYRYKFNQLDLLEKNTEFLKLSSNTQNKLIDLWNKYNVLTIYGVGENVTKIDTFYFWKKENIVGKKYNSIYTALLGAPYGDYTQKDYLAGALLFDRDNRSLAVTSLINNPYEYNDILQISGNSYISKVYNNSDLTQDININLDFDENNISYLNLFNNSLSTYIGKIFFNFQDNNSLEICESKDNCFDEDKTTIAFIKEDENYVYEKSGNEISIKNAYNNSLVTVSKNGVIKRGSGVYFSLNETYGSELYFDIKVGEKVIGKLAFNFIGSSIKTARDESVLKGLLNTSKNSIIIKLDTDDYSIRDIYGNGETDKKAIYYIDPFAKENNLNSFSKENTYSIDNFASQEGIGWKGGNKTLLEFAAGKSVGEASKDYVSVGLVNLGDPVVSLKKITLKIPNTSDDRKFDSTIGKKLNDKSITSYKIFDYNNDTRDDLLFIEEDNFLRLIENEDIHNNIIDQKYIARIVDIGDSELIQAGNFTGDGYDDIFFVNNDGKPFLLNNENKNFVRLSLEDQFSLSGSITRTRSFDMNNDGIDDIVTLDDAGDINIFYGGGSSQNPDFRKNTVSSGYGLSLSNESRNDLSLVYFDGVPQLKELGDNDELISNIKDFNSKIDEAISSGNQTDIINANKENNSNTINEAIVDNLLFVQLEYNTGALDEDNLSDEDKQDELVSSIQTVSSPEISSSIENSIADINNLIDQNGDYISDISSNFTSKTTFIRSQYSSDLGLSVSRIYTDQNGGFLKGGDKVSVDLTLTNTSQNRLDNIAYLEGIPSYFTLVEGSLENDSDLKFKSGIDSYEFLIDNFILYPGESIKINYELETRSLSYGYIEVGLFEKDEIGDDEFGDIILKDNEQNCSQSVEILRSISPESYEKGKKDPECDSDKLKLPGDLEKNKIDLDGNNVPDYIDDLVNGIGGSGVDDNVADYLSGLTDDLYKDSDGDGIPDDEDISPSLGSESFMNSLDSINDSVDKISDGIDNLVEGFGCGFGGGACIASPVNRAPLAPGNDLVVLGKLVGDGLHPFEGLPILAFPTVGPVNVLGVPVPPFWPTNYLGAGGRLGVGGPMSYTPSTSAIRLFITPTITGAVGMAFCMGSNTAGYVPPPGASPLIPGGNCIVAAKPMISCGGGGSDGDPSSLGTVNYIGGGDFGIINGNCSAGTSSVNSPDTSNLDSNFTKDYLTYKRTGNFSSSLTTNYNQIFGSSNISNYDISEPLIGIGGGDGGIAEVGVDVNLGAINQGNFRDVIEVKNTRISAFPDFLMGWLTRQLEEIITKLTDFPTIFVILPDFSGLYNADWIDYIGSGVDNAYEKGKEKEEEKVSKIDSQISALESQKSQYKCGTEDASTTQCLILSTKINDLEAKKGYGFSKQFSGIGQAFEFLSSVPLVTIEPETVNLNIPWIDGTSLERTISDREETVDQRKDEFYKAQDSWSYGATCDQTDPKEKEKCEQQNSASSKILVDTNSLISSLERNIKTLEEYKKFPEKLGSLVNKKQDRLDQILCNVETISSLIGGWIGKNGKRFKAWVELFVLIKAVLKSWQMLADIFLDYEAECHECKNERHDTLDFQFSLISAIIPDIPVIQFPKWPDIILDLHNIRANITIYVPEFEFNLRPIVLPLLPNLYLPESPGVNISLPAIPELPMFELPELPDIPSLPEIELPDLPPPPKLPKLFSSLEGVLNVLKLVTKAMCILKKSPFVPEWRAGDQIAFLTERSGYQPFDFISISLPQFSYPFVDAIKVTTYVNLEFETEFLVEMARIIALPLDSFTTNIDFKIDDLDFRDTVPTNIDVNIEMNGDTNAEIGKLNMKQEDFAILSSLAIKSLVNYLYDNSEQEVDSKEFLQLINKELSSKSISGDPKFDKLRELWETVDDMTYSKEDKLILDLQKSNMEKFDTLKAIINTESQKNKAILKELEEINSKSIFEKISSTKKSDFDAYNQSLEKYNLQFLESAKNLVTGKNIEKEELDKVGKDLLAKINTGVNSLETDNKLLAADTQDYGSSEDINQCQLANSSDYKYNYEGLYIVEDGQSYRLFDYLDDLDGKEETQVIDIDKDNDEDLLYLVGGDLYLKENLKNNSNYNYFTTPPLTVPIGINKFVNGKIYYESVNNFRELTVSDSAININFSASNLEDIHNYRLEYFSIVDKYLNDDNSNYFPNNIKKTIIDAFADEQNSTIIETKDNYTLRKNIGYINYVGMVDGSKLYTKQLKILNTDLDNNELVSISPSTRVYSGKSSLRISYVEDDIEKNVVLAKHSNIEFNSQINIYKISGGNAYVETNKDIVLSGQEISDYIGLPLIFGTKIKVLDDSKLTESSHIDINYYDSSKLGIDLRKLDHYEIYDLGYKDDSYLIRVSVDNDYFYSRIYSFKDNLVGTKNNQVLLSPQIQADLSSPELNYNGVIRVPVYQEKIVDFTNYIYEDDGIAGISSVIINGISEDKYSVIKTSDKLNIKFGKFDQLLKQTLKFSISDNNGNKVEKDIDFEVYSPNPKIDDYDSGIIYGSIDEKLTDEPINLYRIRGGSIKRLVDLSGSNISMTDSGNYDFDVGDEDKQELYFSVDGEEKFVINENTGKISLNGFIYDIKIETSVDDFYPKIIVYNQDGDELFYEQIKFNGENDINIVNNFSDILDNGLYLNILDKQSFSYYKVPEGVSYNPGSIVIYRKTDTTKTPLFVIYKDGRVKAYNDYYSFEYTSYDDYVVFKFIDKHYNKEVARLLYKVDNSYILK